MIHLSHKNIPQLEEIAQAHLNRIKKTLKEEILKLQRREKRGSKRYKLYKYLSQNLESIIISRPDNLLTHVSQVASFNISFAKKDPLKMAFFYSQYSKWGAYELAHQLDIRSCTYCNRNYTHTVGDDTNTGSRPQFDHFMP